MNSRSWSVSFRPLIENWVRGSEAKDGKIANIARIAAKITPPSARM
jgi:hypothetical protein